ncbi:nucleotidyltransferase family protein [bacterium]|nr:nucleotidyltransferase family protein [bacterium]
MKTIILLAGHATRMRPLSSYLNKGMIPVAGRPLAEYVVRSLVRQGFSELVFAVTAFPEQLENYFGDGSRFGAQIEYVARPEPSGTAGEVLALRPCIPEGESFLVHYGDILTALDLRGMRELHETTGATATVGLVTQVEIHAGVGEVSEEGRLVGFEEKPLVGRPCHAAVDMFGPGVWKYLAPGLDFGYHVIPAMLAAGENVRGFVDQEAWWMDVGRLSDLEPAGELMEKVRREGQGI